jgi:uncharacterized protein with PIN domain
VKSDKPTRPKAVLITDQPAGIEPVYRETYVQRTRTKEGGPRCPECGGPLFQCPRADVCDTCSHQDYYP